MGNALELSAIGLAVANVVAVVVLVVRRTLLGARERRRRALEARLVPIALGLVEEGVEAVPPLAPREQVLLAEVLARLARVVKGTARANIASYFAGSAAFLHEVRALSARRAWRRAAAAFAVGDMGGTDVAGRLVDLLGDRDRDVRAAAARSLGRLGDPAAVEPLVVALADRRVPQIVAGQALLEIGPAALPALTALLDDPRAEVRAGATELVGHLGDAREAPLLVRALRDPAARVRANAARALGRVAADDAALELRAALDDRMPFVREAAARALGVVGDERAVEALLAQARADDFEAARAAARAVAAIDAAALARAAARADAGPHLHEAADLAAL